MLSRRREGGIRSHLRTKVLRHVNRPTLGARLARLSTPDVVYTTAAMFATRSSSSSSTGPIAGSTPTCSRHTRRTGGPTKRQLPTCAGRPNRDRSGRSVRDGLAGRHAWQRVLLTGRLDDPGQHQISEHLITSARVIKPEPGIGPAQGIPQMPRMRTDDFQRRTGDAGRIQPEIHHPLAFGQPLPRRRLERLQLRLVMSRTHMLDTARTPP
jgi:hypothetical protein